MFELRATNEYEMSEYEAVMLGRRGTVGKWLRLGLGVVVVIYALAAAAVASGVGRSIELPTPPGALGASLNTDGPSIILSWLERSDTSARLVLSQYSNAQWSTPTVIAEGNKWFTNWADFPAVAVGERLWSAHWLEKLGDSTYAYGVRTRSSVDRGKTWGDPQWLHSDLSTSEHGFVAWFPDPDGGLGAVWLDGRQTMTGEPMTLRTTTVQDDDQQSPETALDLNTCDCCQTDAAITEDGPLVAYRARRDGEIRDIYVTRRVNKQWTEPRSVADDGWVMPGCPVNGPAVAAAMQDVAIAWYTAADGRPRVQFARSSNAGDSFDLPIEIAGSESLGRLDAVMLADGRVVVSHIAEAADRAEVRLEVITVDGDRATHIVGSTKPLRAAGVPRMALRDDQTLFIVWREIRENDAVLRLWEARL